MKCVICKTGTTKKGTATVKLDKKATIVIIKNVPADVCSNCGEYYLSAEMTRNVLKIANDAYKKGSEIEIIKFNKVA